MDKKLVRELKNLADPTMDPYDTVCGKTMCADDFYEGKSNVSLIFIYEIQICFEYLFIYIFFSPISFTNLHSQTHKK